MALLENVHHLERPDMPPRAQQEAPDASRLSFPLQLVIFLVTTVLSVAGSQWATTYSLRSDVRDILTRQAAQAQLDEERAGNVRDAIGDLKRQQTLQAYEIQEIKLSLAQSGVLVIRKGAQ